METSGPSNEIKIGVRALTAVKNAEILSDPIYLATASKWALHVQIDRGRLLRKNLIPRYSVWYIVLEPEYPFGNVAVHPAKDGGIRDTFEHQVINLDCPNLPWRSGNICIGSPSSNLGIAAGTNEPLGDSEERLRWHLSRAVIWVRAAARGRLVKKGDPFELPFYLEEGSPIVVHDESSHSFKNWDLTESCAWGFIRLRYLHGNQDFLFAHTFLTRDCQEIRSIPHNAIATQESNSKREMRGVWWLWPSPPVIRQWQSPITWAELREAARSQGLDVDEFLREMVKSLRDRQSHILLIGYPIPSHYGKTPIQVHWQSIEFPLMKEGGKPPNGFRNNEAGWWQRDRTTTFGPEVKVRYRPTQNWHPDRILARGRLNVLLRDAKVVLIGCGALGSILAEILARGGVSDLYLVDKDILEPGNLVRHTLSGLEVGKNKAVTLASRLSTVAPFSKIEASSHPLPSARVKLEEFLEERDVIIDCTGSDDVLQSIGNCWWSFQHLFVSASVGYEARRTYIYGHKGHFFQLPAFHNKLEPFLIEDRALLVNAEEILEGPGCWSPLFPARWDDLLIAGGSIIKVIEEFLEAEILENTLVVYEKTLNPEYQGLSRRSATYVVEKNSD